MNFVVEMPLNVDGNGPEMNPEAVVETRWQIWDDTFRSVTEYPTQEQADYECRKLNLSI